MKFLDIQAAIGTAIILLSLPCDAKHGHGLSHLEVLGRRHSLKRSQVSSRIEGMSGLKKRSTCEFPTGAGLVAVTPGSMNAGWAMSPDQQCVPDSFCPYACPPGKVMNQWNPEAKNYPDPKSMDGGLYCNRDGDIVDPFPGKPYCVDGTGAVGAQNNCGKTVSFCQTVLPGNEAMIIPTKVDDWTQIAVPGPDYWLSTAAHYYINPPGTTTAEGCIWGDGTDPIGNWSPFIAGANTDSNGNTFNTIGWNPIFMESHHSKTPPTFGVKIVCSGDCVGTPCSIDPSEDGVGGVTSGQQAVGAGGASFCVVTVPKGSTANIVLFNVGDSAGGSGDKKSSTPSAEPTSEKKPEPTTTKEPEPETTSSELETTTTSETPSTTPISTTSKASHSITPLEETTSSTIPSERSAFSPHILFQSNNFTRASTSMTEAATLTPTAVPAAETSKKSEATSVSGSMFSLLVVFVAAGYLL